MVDDFTITFFVDIMHTILLTLCILLMVPALSRANQPTASINVTVIIPHMLRVDRVERVDDKWVYTITTNMRTIVIDGDQFPVGRPGTVTIERSTPAQYVSGL